MIRLERVGEELDAESGAVPVTSYVKDQIAFAFRCVGTPPPKKLTKPKIRALFHEVTEWEKHIAEDATEILALSHMTQQRRIGPTGRATVSPGPGPINAPRNQSLDTQRFSTLVAVSSTPMMSRPAQEKKKSKECPALSRRHPLRI